MMGMVDGGCMSFSRTSWYCAGNNTVGVTSDVEKITLDLRGINDFDLKSLENFTNLHSIKLYKSSLRVLKSSDFISFPKLAKLYIDNEYSQIKLEKVELTGMYNHFLNHWLVVGLCRPSIYFYEKSQYVFWGSYLPDDFPSLTRLVPGYTRKWPNNRWKKSKIPNFASFLTQNWT